MILTCMALLTLRYQPPLTAERMLMVPLLEEETCLYQIILGDGTSICLIVFQDWKGPWSFLVHFVGKEEG